MASDEKWYFSKEQLENSPSRQSGIDAQKELVYRQQAAYFIQDMGQRLRVSQLCINTASVYMHRFYVFHSFTHFPWNSIAAAALFLAAKVEEQPRKLEHVIRVHNICKNSRDVQFDVTSERYQQQSQDLVFNENVLLQTLGFDVAIDHPHAHVVKCCQLVRASKDLGQTSYFMASTSLHLTTMCLQYKPTVVACFCIHLACKWSNWEIPLSNESREWFSYVDTSVTPDMLAQLTEEFLTIFGRCPSRLKEKIMAVGDGGNINRNLSHPNLSTTVSIANTDAADRKVQPTGSSDSKDGHHRSHHHEKTGEDHKHRNSASFVAATTASNSGSQQQREREYMEKKVREQVPSFYPKHKLQQPQHTSTSTSAAKASGQHSQPHRGPVDAKMKSSHPRPSNASREMFRDAGALSDKDAFAARSEKDEKRAHPPMKNSELNNADVHSADKRVDTSIARTRSLPSDPKHLYKHDARRHADDQSKNVHVKNELERKSHAFLQPNPAQTSNQPAWFETYNKTNLHTHTKPNVVANSSSQHSVQAKLSDMPHKSVPKVVGKQEPNNGMLASNGCYSYDDGIKDVPMKKPSMFSPEKTPPRKGSQVANSKLMASNMNQVVSMNAHILSKKPSNHGYDGRSKKMEQAEGFENMLRDSSLSVIDGMTSMMKSELPELTLGGGFNSNSFGASFSNAYSGGSVHQMGHHPAASMRMQSAQPALSANAKGSTKERKSLDMLLATSQSASNLGAMNMSHPIVNGIETNPTLISNLLKEAPSLPHLATISNAHNDTAGTSLDESKDSDAAHHRDKKKKNKEKHKHKDKSREDKEKKRKHKEKDKEKHKSKNRDKEKSEDTLSQPIKITISKDKIQPPEPPSAGGGLKIKIPKDKIKSEIIEQPSAIKIKIPKDVMHIGGQESSTSTVGKKRERDRSSPAEVVPHPHKQSKHGRQQHVSEKQNGRSSFGSIGKVGDDESVPMHCISKGMSSGI